MCDGVSPDSDWRRKEGIHRECSNLLTQRNLTSKAAQVDTTLLYRNIFLLILIYSNIFYDFIN